jgi:nucleoside-diphosphate-sugar epimerase
MSSQRVLVTGGTGFLGANLVHHLVRNGHELHLVVRPNAKRWRLAGLAHKLTFHAADLLDFSAVRLAIDSCRPEVIYHLAGYGVMASQNDRDGILTGNVLATANLLAALEGHEDVRLVHAGSSAEYGAKENPMREDDRLEPATLYGITKACATHLCQAERFKGRWVTTVRIFTAYGPWESLPRLVPYVMDCCRSSQRPQLTSGQQQRDFIFAQDVVELLELAATHPNARGQILHAATGKPTSVREVVETIMARRAGEPDCWQASIERTTALLGWKPRFTLRQGLELAWSWHDAQRQAAA